MMIADGGERGDCLTLLPVVSSKIYKISSEKGGQTWAFFWGGGEKGDTVWLTSSSESPPP